jgi:hypothetical protein
VREDAGVRALQDVGDPRVAEERLQDRVDVASRTRHLQVKDEGGGWRQRAPFPGEPLADTPANRERAERALAELRALLVAQEEARGGEAGPQGIRPVR